MRKANGIENENNEKANRERERDRRGQEACAPIWA